jgi:cell division protein FtsW
MRTERHQPDYILMIAVLMLTGIGIVTVYSASTVIELHNGQSAAHMAIRQLGASIFGLIVFYLATYLSYHFWFKHAAKLLLLAVSLLLLVLVPGVGRSSLGATRWLGTTSFHLQPSAVAILVVIMYLSFLLTKKMNILHDSRRTFRPAMLVVLMLTILILIEPDMGTSTTLFGTALVVMFASGLRMRPIILTLAVMLPSAYLVAHFASYRSSRLESFFHPFQTASGNSYQLIQGLTAITNGGLTGRGFDLSIMATGYLPEPYTDFIFAVFTEQWGWLGDAALLAIFAVITWRGFRIARYARDRFGALMAVGLTSTIIIQAAINLCAVTWLLPVTGIPLPFISYGGTAIVINLFGMGILLSVSRETADVALDHDALAEIISVDEFLAGRAQTAAGKSSLQKTQRPAKVTSLKTHRSTWNATGSQKNSGQIPASHTRRNLSLSWRDQQSMSNQQKDAEKRRNSKRDKR